MSSKQSRVKKEEGVVIGSVQNGNIVISHTKNRQKTKVVLERENQMKLLKQQFPHIDSMKIHDILSKAHFDMTLAQIEAEKIGKRNVSFDSAERSSHGNLLQAIKCDSNFSGAVDDPLAAEFQPNANRDIRPITGVRNQQKLRIERNVVKTQEVEEEAVFIKEEPAEDYAYANHLHDSDERVLNFFQNAIFEELKFLDTNPDKGYDVAQKIYGLRPFANRSDLEYKLKKNFPFDVIAVAKEMFSVQSKIDEILGIAKTISENVEKALQSTPIVTRQPKLFLYLLKKPRMDVLNWLMVMHKENVNGILNYPLGPGRMLQLIALFALLKERNKNVNGLPHLVIVPSNIIDNWVEAFKRFCPSLKVFVYHGTKEERTAQRLKFYKGELYVYEVILTTYTVVVHIADEREVFRTMTTDYVVFDETDTVKNINIQLYDNLIKTKARRRLLITSGSLQGNPLELMSVLYFILPLKLLGGCYLPESSLQKALRGHLVEGEFTHYEKKVIDEVNEILEPFIWQNLQEEELDEISLDTVNVTDDDSFVDTADYVQLESTEAKENYSAGQTSMLENQQKLSPDKVVIKEEKVIDSDNNEWNPYPLEDTTDDNFSDFNSDCEGSKRKISLRGKLSTSLLPKRKRKSKLTSEDDNTTSE